MKTERMLLRKRFSTIITIMWSRFDTGRKKVLRKKNELKNENDDDAKVSWRKEKKNEAWGRRYRLFFGKLPVKKFYKWWSGEVWLKSLEEVVIKVWE
jgi:pectate lyase